MRTFHVLLDGRPEVIGEFRTLDHYMDLRVKTAHTVRCPYDIILGDRGVEDSLDTEFLLHAFGDVEYATLFFIGYILSPDKCIRVVPELRFQRLVDRRN